MLGAGPLGCELAQAFARLGSRVTVIERPDRLLPREDADAAARPRRPRSSGTASELPLRQRLRVARGRGEAPTSTGEHLELGRGRDTGRRGRVPNVQGLGLEAVGVRYTAHRRDSRRPSAHDEPPHLRRRGRLPPPQVHAHGRRAGPHRHPQRALRWARRDADRLIVPWCTYTDPEIAHVGLDEAEAAERGIAADTFVQLDDVDRAILDGETEGS